MNTASIHPQHSHHHHRVVPLAVAGTTAVLAAALLAGPIHLPLGGEDNPPAPAPHVAVGAGAAAATGRCVLSGHPTPGDVPAPACRPAHVAGTLATRSARGAAPTPCFKEFRVWSKDVARPFGCD